MVLHTHHVCAGRGMTLLEIVVALSMLATLLVALGASLGTLGNQSELNRQLAVVDAEVGNALSVIHTAPFDAIGQDLVGHGFVSVGNFSYRKDLGAAPSSLPNGQVTIALLGVTVNPADGTVVLPDPLGLNVTIAWDMALTSTTSRTFATVRTR